MKKYIIPETMVVVTDEELMQIGIHESLAGGGQLSNDGLFDDMDDGLDNTFQKTYHVWDEEEEAR